MYTFDLTLTINQERNLQVIQSLKSKCAVWLGAANLAPYIDQYLEDKTPDTCEWIKVHPAYVAWSLIPQDATPEERILLISGQSGCGKTMLACSIAQALGEEDKLVLFFSFSSNDASRRTLVNLSHSFVWQLLQQSDSEAFHVIEELIPRGQPSSKDLWHALDQVSAMARKPLYWIVDGLDECEDPTSLVFEKLITFNGRASHGVILGRQHAIEDLSSSTPILEITPDLVQTDIGAYVRMAIDNSMAVHVSDLKDVAIDRLNDGSQGMFLWAKFMIDDLCKPSSRAELQERLYSLPQGLHKAYARILSRLIEPLDSFDREFMKTVLTLIVSARRPLKIAELQHAVAMV